MFLNDLSDQNLNCHLNLFLVHKIVNIIILQGILDSTNLDNSNSDNSINFFNVNETIPQKVKNKITYIYIYM